MEKLEQILTYASYAVAVLFFLLGVYMKVVNAKNAKKAILSEEEMKKAQWINWLRNACKTFVTVAEDFLSFNGATKKEWVQTKLQQFCLDKKIPFNVDQTSELIEEEVAFTKKVNKRDKDKEAPKLEFIDPQK